MDFVELGESSVVKSTRLSTGENLCGASPSMKKGRLSSGCGQPLGKGNEANVYSTLSELLAGEDLHSGRAKQAALLEESHDNSSGRECNIPTYNLSFNLGINN